MEEYLRKLKATEEDNVTKNLTVRIFMNELKQPYSICALDIDMSTMSKDVNEARLSDITVAYNSIYQSKEISTGLRFDDMLFLYNIFQKSEHSFEFHV